MFAVSIQLHWEVSNVWLNYFTICPWTLAYFLLFLNGFMEVHLIVMIWHLLCGRMNGEKSTLQVFLQPSNISAHRQCLLFRNELKKRSNVQWNCFTICPWTLAYFLLFVYGFMEVHLIAMICIFYLDRNIYCWVVYSPKNELLLLLRPFISSRCW